MNGLEKEVKQLTAFQLACELSKLLSLAEESDDPKLFKLADAKKLVYAEEELKIRLHELLPGLPKVESQVEEEPENSNYMNVILGTYYKRRSKAKSKTELKPEARLRFFVKVKNSLNTVITSIPVMAISKTDAIAQAKKKGAKYGTNLTFEVS